MWCYVARTFDLKWLTYRTQIHGILCTGTLALPDSHANLRRSAGLKIVSLMFPYKSPIDGLACAWSVLRFVRSNMIHMCSFPACATHLRFEVVSLFETLQPLSEHFFPCQATSFPETLSYITRFCNPFRKS